jgi:MHS family proline/betaine transporter-like MFS transporter
MRWKRRRRSSSTLINWSRAIAGLQEGPKVSFKEIATKHWRSLLACIGLVIATNVTYYMLLTCRATCRITCTTSEDHGVLIIIAIMVGMLFVQPIMGLLSDRFGRRPFMIMGSVRCLRWRFRHLSD